MLMEVSLAAPYDRHRSASARRTTVGAGWPRQRPLMPTPPNTPGRHVFGCSAAGGRADAGTVALGVLDDPVRRRRTVADEATPSVQDRLQPAFGLVRGYPHVEVPALLERLLRERPRLVAVRCLPPYRGHLAAGIDRLAVLHLAAEQGCIERRKLWPDRGIQPELQLGQPRGVGIDRELGCVAADLTRQVEVTAGDTADIVAGESDDHVGVRELNVGVMVGGLGRGTDLVDQRQTGCEVTGAEASLDPVKDLPPVLKAGLAHLRRGQLLLGVSHGSRSVWSAR